MEVYSANEYWVKAASLFTTDPSGTKDLPDHPMARDYFISSHQHGTGRQTVKGNCQQFQNPLDSAPVLRALWVALDDWSTQGHRPAAERNSSLVRRNARAAAAAKRRGLSKDSGGHVYGAEVDAVFAQLRPEVLQHRHHDHRSSGREATHL